MTESKKEAKKDEVADPKEQTPQADNKVELTADELDAVVGGRLKGLNKTTDVTMKRGVIGSH